MKNYLFFRKKYPKFVYQGYSYKIAKNDLQISFDFAIRPDIFFKPKVTIKNINKKKLALIGEKALNNLIFHLGLIELISYWKSTCSPEIEIKAGHLNKEQIKWWKDLIINGMGEFFYKNKIDFTQVNFLKITSKPSMPNVTRSDLVTLKKRVIAPIGGGKDSIVTMEILKKQGKDINCFSLNPTQTAKRVMRVGNCKNPIIVNRKIDKKLLELNQNGYLNGHTPFSAYLAFLSIFCAVIFDYKYIAFSNERSASEGNLKYLGKTINHQYSKSFEFEQKFRDYSKKYLAKNAEYFSFLRPLYEIQIAKLFSQFPQYFPVFLSCNEAYKTNSGRKKPEKKWCGNCSKCLFVFAILYPFVEEKNLIKIFRKNLFENKKLLPIMLELIGLPASRKDGKSLQAGERRFKPFECVGTKKECLIAFYLARRSFKRRRVNKNLPYLLKYFEKKILPKHPELEKESKKIMCSWDKQNNLPKNFKKILKKIDKN
ncbi:hypothetical protein KAS79_00845 [Candidatus Parcubacteria bacterium]|nr:hypothetical protein [Candidatus Parcubacteria bacterium]